MYLFKENLFCPWEHSCPSLVTGWYYWIRLVVKIVTYPPKSIFTVLSGVISPDMLREWKFWVNQWWVVLRLQADNLLSCFSPLSVNKYRLPSLLSAAFPFFFFFSSFCFLSVISLFKMTPGCVAGRKPVLTPCWKLFLWLAFIIIIILNSLPGGPFFSAWL